MSYTNWDNFKTVTPAPVPFNVTNVIYVNVREYGAIGDGETDSTQAFQQACDYARSLVIAYKFKIAVTVLIPGGRYKITDQVKNSPFVKIKTQGFVFIHSYVANKSTIWITNQTGDPDFKDLMDKQQYNRSPYINANDGGMLIQSMLDITTSQAIGLEIGSQTNLGSYMSTSRFSIDDVAIEKFDVAVQMNIYNNFIGTFNNLHLEWNNTNVRFGRTVGSVVNSGENISFHGGVFAGAEKCFDWFTDGFGCNFYGCSFDYNDILFYFRRGYKKINIFGGHIEGDGNAVIADATLVSDSASPPQLYLNSPRVLCNGNPLFKGMMALYSDNIQLMRSTNSFNSFLYLCDSNVVAKERNHILQGGYDMALSSKVNRLNNSKFQSANLGGGDASGPFNEFAVTSGNFGTPVVTASIPAGSSYNRALKVVSTAGTSWLQILTSNAYACKPGDVVQMGGVIYVAGADIRNVSFKADFLDILGNVISTSNSYANKTGATPNTWNTFFSENNLVVPPGAVSLKMYASVSSLATGEVGYIGELFLGIS